MTDRVNVRRSHYLHLGVDNNYYIREIPTEKFLAPSVCIAQTVQSQYVRLSACLSIPQTNNIIGLRSIRSPHAGTARYSVGENRRRKQAQPIAPLPDSITQYITIPTLMKIRSGYVYAES